MVVSKIEWSIESRGIQLVNQQDGLKGSEFQFGTTGGPRFYNAGAVKWLHQIQMLRCWAAIGVEPEEGII